jgi:hypothetical protein
MKTTTLPLKHSMQRSPSGLALLLIQLALAWLVLLPQARATCQEGCDLINFNTFLGDGALIDNTTGFNDTALGFGALSRNTTGVSNTATGNGALNFNTSGVFNTATGAGALASNTHGNMNTANGEDALYFNNTGNNNTANGVFALTNNHEGFNNTASGHSALLRNITGSNNIALGYLAGQNLTSGSDNIYIGNLGGSFHESRRIRIGRVGGHTDTFIAGISGATVPDGVGVVVGTNGKLGTVVSSERFKDAIKPMDKASEAILSLKPVTFRYKHDLDPEGISQFGLVAEDVEKVNPDLVARDEHGKPYTVRYEAVNAMLLNEFLKEHRKNEEQQAMIERQQKQIDALTAGLQNVSAKLELTQSARQMVLNNQ